MTMKKIRIPAWIRSTASVTAMIVVGLTKAILDIVGAFNGPDSEDSYAKVQREAIHDEYNWDGTLNMDGDPNSSK